MPETSLFCRIAQGQIPVTLVMENEHCVAFADINPQAPTHLLVIPRKHVATLNDVADTDADAVGQVMLMAAAVARAAGISESGYRTVLNTNAAAGQTVFHLHAHVLGGREMRWPPG